MTLCRGCGPICPRQGQEEIFSFNFRLCVSFCVQTASVSDTFVIVPPQISQVRFPKSGFIIAALSSADFFSQRAYTSSQYASASSSTIWSRSRPLRCRRCAERNPCWRPASKYRPASERHSMTDSRFLRSWFQTPSNAPDGRQAFRTSSLRVFVLHSSKSLSFRFPTP